MNVKELIEQFSKLDPELPVVYDDCVYGLTIVPEVEELAVKNKDGKEVRVAFLKDNGAF